MESRDATFFENEFPMKIGASRMSSHDSIPELHESNIHADDNTYELEQNPEKDDNTVTRRSKRQRVAKSFGEDFIIYLVDDTPTTISEAYSSPDSDMWKEAVQSEMNSIMSNGTWEVVDRPFGCKPVGCKWVFKKKLRPDGTIEKYKARLVAKGYTQKEGNTAFIFNMFCLDDYASTSFLIMANLVAQPEIQARLRAEIHQVTATGGSAGVQEQDLPRIPYLRAVVLEGLRRHPPGHFAIPHAATGIDDDGGGLSLEGFHVPRRASLNFPLVALGLDEAVWPDPLQFRPERFLPGGEGADVDLTGAKEVKMIPFGAGRRICPGMALALLHLEFFVASLVAEFEWLQVPGEPVEFAEKQELSVVMRRPLRATVVR
ncbi:cytochrome P450 89A2-like [Miscanthus floridulus]|uniref:cytochrome P450 89A2-like n=1 Tax=Miscanthus floridulus TaxID=154761 RepID=UPI0034576FEB